MRHYRRLAACGWMILLIFTAAALTPATAAAQSGRQERPRLPDEATSGSQHFLIHYTLSGDAAVSPRDADGNGTPDYVESVAAALEFAWQTEVVQMGWAAPPHDRGEGGDDRIDVYLENDMAGDVAGYTESAGGFVGDNPNTPQRERHAAYSYLSIDNDFAEVNPADGTTPQQVMQATVAHEFNHVLQSGYDNFDPQTWLYEATATWMEARVYPDISDSLNYLPDLLDHPEGCLAAEDSWYGSWLLIQYLSEHYGPETIRSIWENSGQVDGYEAIDQALAPFNSSLQAEARNFAVANLVRAYRDGASYPTVRLGGQIDGAGTFAPSAGVQSLGASYIRLVGQEDASVSFAGYKSVSAQLVGVRGRQADVIDFAGGTADINLGQYDETYVVVHNDELAISQERCRARDFSVTLSAGSGSPSPVSRTWPAPNFTAASTASSGGSGRNFHQAYQGGDATPAQSPGDLKVDFPTIIPTPPQGYYFDYAYIMTADDFGTSAAFYVPDALQSANFDYLNAEGDWLSIAESPAGYHSLQDWEDAIHYQPSGQPETINGVEVLVEDTTVKQKSQHAATFVYKGLFIVVDGDGSTEDLMAMVLALIDGGAPTPEPQGGTLSAAPQPDAATVAPAPTAIPAANNSISLVILGALSVCGLGMCLGGVGLGMVVLAIRRRET